MSDSEQEQAQDGTGTMILGFAIIILGIVAVFFAGRAIYKKWVSPPPSMISLSAYFVDDAGKPVSDPSLPAYEASHIRIRGAILGTSQPALSGSVRVNVLAPNLQFQQSVSAPVANGQFEIADPTFNAIHPTTPATITAFVTIGKETDIATIELNTRSPTTKNWVYAGIYAFVFAFAFVFFYAFTGHQTSLKNQVAIIFSYLVIAIFLGVPILAPVLLIRAFPEMVNDMIGVPTGLVVTCTSSQESRQHQWALNIGGYSYVPGTTTAIAVPTPTPPVQAAAVTAPTLKSIPNTKPADPTADPAPTATPSKAAATPAADPASAPKPAKPATPVPPAAATAALAPGDCRAVPPPPATQAELEHDSSSLNAPLIPPVVIVEGGLVIPLYVIVLSVLGGAINMTRKVPSFQREDEATNFTGFNSVTSLGIAVMNRFKTLEKLPADVTSQGAQAAATPVTPVEQAKHLDDQIDPLVIQQLQRNTDSNTAVVLIQALVDKMKALYAAADDQHPLPFASYDEWFASHPRLREVLRGNWRVALLNQYMYLISAPFLAIVTYYLLDLLGLSKPGVVVVLSFSVGLISEKIVTWILGVASGYLQTPKTT